ncbi:extracellular solute-binding protein [Paenibacillus soyae]|uniref:Extracellular solute-binding protein n=1 Tax=Paenibacillus soyae TaxID=2969249 RepID=A0A9X2MQS9_9BACL|nr:extracellular solute-binding protein [Paenibacillus soyae]MCR2804705.1 extracellular solute-binding protein [Paenibacillus soyae]
MKKMTIVLSILILFSMLSACSTDSTPQQSDNSKAIQNFNASAYPIVNEKITLKLMGSKSPLQGPWDQMMFFEEMERMTNIHFEFETPDDSAYQEKKNLTFASGNLPDVFFGGKLSSFDQFNYGKQGLLIPLEDLIDKYAPHLKALLDKDPSIRKAITAPDGHIYALPQVSNISRDIMSLRTYLNAEWMEALGNPKLPETTDELLELLKRFRDEDPNRNGKKDELPLSFNNVKGDSLHDARAYLMPAFGLLEDRYNQSRLQVEGDKVSAVFLSDSYRQFLTYMNKLHAENLLDAEIFTHTDQQLKAKGQEDRIGMTFQAAPFLIYNVDVANVEANAKYPLVLPLTSPINDKKLFSPNPHIVTGTFAITQKNKYPEATIRWVDYLYTSEGFMLGNQGIEGEAWKWRDESKTVWDRLVPEGMKANEFRAKNTPDVGTPIPLLKSKELNDKQSDVLAAILNEQAEKLTAFAKSPMPLLFLTEEEENRINILKNDLLIYISQMEAKFVLGKEKLENWDEYLATLKKLNVDEYVEIYQRAYDRWKKAE